MATAFYPQGMSHNTFPRSYKTWKGTGYFSNPIGITSGNIRPYTNFDLTNSVIYKPGLPRPIKHYRKGISANTNTEYQENREVTSSRGSNLVSQLIDLPGCYTTLQNTIDEVDNIEYTNKLCSKFRGIAMVKDIYPNVNYYENPPVIMKEGNTPIFLKTTDFCCSAPKNALNLLRTSTNLKQNYYTTNYQYLQNRCQTYDQRIFNFAVPGDIVGKPGSPETVDYYVANCLPNFIIKEGLELEIIDVISKRLIDYDSSFKTIILKLKSNTNLQTFLQELFSYIDETPIPNSEEIKIYIYKIVNISSQYLQNLTGTTKHCGKVIYKPNNSQFATQGAVSASTYILKKDVVTLETSLQTPQIYKTKSTVYCKKTNGNRPSNFAYLYPELYDRKYTPNINNTHKHRALGNVGSYINSY